MQKQLALGIFALLALLLVTSAVLPTHFVEAKKYKRCDVKVQVRVTNAINGSSYAAQVTVDERTKEKISTAEENGTLAIPFMFKNVKPCLNVGDEINGNVNGTEFSGEFKSYKKPNKIAVTLP